VYQTQPLHVLVHSGLKAHFDSPLSEDSPLGTLRHGLHRVDFVDDEDLAAPGCVLDLPVLLPVNSEFQAEALRTIRVRRPLSLLIAVTNDVSGHHTYYAIRAGANFVCNLGIMGESQIGMMHAQLQAHRVSKRVDTPAARLRPVSALHQSDRELIRLLRTSMTVSEIARRHYCSERSMYRRIRRLYDDLGVRGRAELMTLASEPAMRDPLPKRAS
jgi:DNA-binding CsgD family transcriptional regulator